MTRTTKGLLTALGLILVSFAGLASQAQGIRPPEVLAERGPQAFDDTREQRLARLKPGDRLDQALYEQGEVSRFGIRREIVRIGNHEFIIDDQNRQIIHISVY